MTWDICLLPNILPDSHFAWSCTINYRNILIYLLCFTVEQLFHQFINVKYSRTLASLLLFAVGLQLVFSNATTRRSRMMKFRNHFTWWICEMFEMLYSLQILSVGRERLRWRVNIVQQSTVFVIIPFIRVNRPFNHDEFADIYWFIRYRTFSRTIFF